MKSNYKIIMYANVYIIMANPWLEHVKQWRKQYGQGMEYKQVLIQARASYTPVKKGSGLSASRPPRAPPPSGAQQAATRARLTGSGGGTSRMRVVPEPTYYTDSNNSDSDSADETPVAVPVDRILNSVARLADQNPNMTAREFERHYLSDVRDYERRARRIARRRRRQNQVRPASPVA